jgi:hypothetical protein
MAGSCENDNEPLGSIKWGGGGDFLTSEGTGSFPKSILLD